MPPSATKDGLYPALLKVQAEAPKLQKTAINPHFRSRFVPLEEVHEAIIPILNTNGLVWTTCPGHTENGSPVLDYSLIHASTGEKVSGSMALLPAKADPQGQGSAITYARRYALMAVLGLVADLDDDGNAASKKPKAVAEAVVDLAEAVAAIPGTTELANKSQLTKLAKAKELLGPTRFDAYLVSQGVDSPEELTEAAAESVLTWARGQAKKKAA